MSSLTKSSYVRSRLDICIVSERMLDNLLNVDSSIRIDFTPHFTSYTLLGYLQHAVAISKEAVFTIRYSITMGSAGFEPAASSAQGWHHTKLDNDPGQFSFFFLRQ